MRSLIAKKENSIDEKGAQIRSANPGTPLTNQLWINTTTKKLSFYDGVVKDIFAGYLQGAEPSTVFEVPLLNIDWALGTVFRKINLQNTINITFTNVAEGQTIVFIGISDSLTASTIVFPGGTKIQTGDSYALSTGKGIAIELSRINGVTYARTIFKADLAKFPYGPLGDLVIANGVTKTYTAGSILDFRNLTIEAGGTLNIQGGGSGAITLIGVKENLIINGVIKGNDGLFGSASFSVVTPLGESVSYYVPQAQAGGGSNGGYPAGSGGPGGSLGYGGGGGGGGQAGQSRGWGGHGGVDNSPGGYAPNNLAPGAGNVSLGNGYYANEDGQAYYYGKHGGGSGGGGGKGTGAYGGSGGGYKGKHGLGLYLYVLGTISGSGQVQLNGLAGFRGGYQYGNNGGGGGGAGGSGGSLWVRARAPFTVPYTVSGGAGGAGYGGNGNGGSNGSFSFVANTSDIRS